MYGPRVLLTLQALSLPPALLNPPFPAVTVTGHSQSQMLMMYLEKWRRGWSYKATRPSTSSPLNLIQLVPRLLVAVLRSLVPKPILPKI